MNKVVLNNKFILSIVLKCIRLFLVSEAAADTFCCCWLFTNWV